MSRCKILISLAFAALFALCAMGLVACSSSQGSTSSDASSTSSSSSEESSSSSDSSASSSDDSSSSSSSSTSSSTASSDSGSIYIGSAPESSEYASGIHHAVITVEGYDPINVELDADAAPVTVYNFCTLANDGFYDGLGFHRIVEDFCLQGGDPSGDGTGGSDLEIIGEFSDNGVVNALADSFVRGTIAMARATDPNSASSQFFITLSDSAATSLDGQYAAFGTVDEAGMEVVDQIVSDYIGVATGSSGTIDDVSAQPVIRSIEITD